MTADVHKLVAPMDGSILNDDVIQFTGSDCAVI